MKRGENNPNIKIWKEKFPNNFDECFDVSINQGWDKLVQETLEKLVYLCPNIQIHQIKEKFGQLRIYFRPSNESMKNSICNDIVNYAESGSAYICEFCGKHSWEKIVRNIPGRKWLHSICDDCIEEKREDK